ncbi:MAG: lipid-A-disaccharide synthase N-terminal domain-containing protein [Pseudomonadota bacterium]
MTFNAWVAFGLLGQAAFSARFIVQWIISEKKQESTIPVVFWYLSLLGGMVLFAYAIHQQDLVFMLGQGSGLVVYIRNIILIKKKERLQQTESGEMKSCEALKHKV